MDWRQRHGSLAQLVDTGRYDDNLVQSAVWVLSDGNDIASTGALDGTPNDSLRLRLSGWSGQPAPRYTVRYASDEIRACSQRPASISRHISMDLTTAQHLTVVVKGDHGRVMRMLHDNLLLQAGNVDLPLAVDVLDWPPGRYAFYVYTTEATSVRRLPFTL